MPLSTRKPLSVVHTMGDYGQLHCSSMEPHMLENLRQICLATSPNAIHTDQNILPPEVRAVLQQSHLDQPLVQVKCMDGYVLMGPNHKIMSIVKDEGMTAPSRNTQYATGSGALVRVRKCSSDVSRMLDKSQNPYPTLVYAIVHPSPDDDEDTLPRQYKSFTLVHHDGITGPDEISRYSRVDDMIAKLAAAIPLQPEPRVIMQAPLLGTLFGRCLNGKDADLIKQTFLSLAAQAGSNMYETPVKISDEMGRLLMISPNDPKGPIYFGRLVDGIIGWRLRDNGAKSFLFVANCEEFHGHQPVKVKKSELHLYGMHYESQSEEAPRVFVTVKTSGGGGAGGNGSCPFGTPLITLPDTTVQMVLNIIDYKVRNFGRHSVGGQNYTSWCLKKAAHDLHDPDIHPFQKDVARAILTAGGGNIIGDYDDNVPRKIKKGKKGSKKIQNNFMFAAAACSNNDYNNAALYGNAYNNPYSFLCR